MPLFYLYQAAAYVKPEVVVVVAVVLVVVAVVAVAVAVAVVLVLVVVAVVLVMLNVVVAAANRRMLWMYHRPHLAVTAHHRRPRHHQTGRRWWPQSD